MKELIIKDTVFKPGRPKVAVPVMGTTPEEIVEECEEVRTLPCDIIEWRADCYLAAAVNLEEKLRDKDFYFEIMKILDDINLIAEEKPVIFTVRTAEQGGRVQMNDEQLSGLLDFVSDSGLVDLVDMEFHPEASQEEKDILQEKISIIQAKGCSVILSYHDFSGMPGPMQLVDILSGMYACGADICKLAAMAYDRQDAETLLKAAAFLTKNDIGPIAVMAMGEWGKTTRVAAGKYGSCMTFASGRSQSAPGQADAFTMKKWLDDYYGEE